MHRRFISSWKRMRGDIIQCPALLHLSYETQRRAISLSYGAVGTS
jgi:hypothetical protein